MKLFYSTIIAFILGVIIGHAGAWESGYAYSKHQFHKMFQAGLKAGKTFHIEGWDNLKFHPRRDNGINFRYERR